MTAENVVSAVLAAENGANHVLARNPGGRGLARNPGGRGLARNPGGRGLAARTRVGARAQLAAAFVVAAIILAGCSAPAQGGDVANQGYVSGDGSVKTWTPAHRSAPVTLTGTDYAGAAADTGAWRGDVVVLNTWYSGCAPCRAEAPDLVALATGRAPDGVHFLGINTTDEAGAAQAFQRTFAVPYPSIDDRDGQAVATLSGTVPLQAVPSTVVLDRQGRVAARVIGMVEKSTLSALVDDVLAESPA